MTRRRTHTVYLFLVGFWLFCHQFLQGVQFFGTNRAMLRIEQNLPTRYRKMGAAPTIRVGNKGFPGFGIERGPSREGVSVLDHLGHTGGPTHIVIHYHSLLIFYGCCIYFLSCSICLMMAFHPKTLHGIAKPFICVSSADCKFCGAIEPCT